MFFVKENFAVSLIIDWDRCPFLRVLILKLAIAIVLVPAAFLPVQPAPQLVAAVDRVPLLV